MRSRLIPLVGLIAATAISGAACSAPDPGVRATQSVAADTDIFGGGGASGDGREYEIIDGVIDFGELGPQHPEYDGYLTAAILDVQQFWEEAFPEAYGAPFPPLEGGIYAAYPERTSPIPACAFGGGVATYDEVAMNAYYCSVGDYIAYDDFQLLPQFVSSLGREAVAIIMAHEFGHAVQFRIDEFDQPVILTEQQADCFAGAWAARAASGGSDLVFFDDNGVRAGLIAMLNVADPILRDGSDPLADGNAHGTGFDRVGAFQDGFFGGVQRCTTFFTENRESSLIDLPFDVTDPNAGNLPLFDPAGQGNDIATLVPDALDQFWVDLLAQNDVAFTAPPFVPFSQAGPLPTCSGVSADAWVRSVVYCPDDNTVYWDQDFAVALATDPSTGDMSVGYLFATAYSDAVQYALGSQLFGEQRALVNDCLSGAWVGWTIPPDDTRVIRLSAGDLDEAIVTLLLRGDETSDTDVAGTAFDKVDSFRGGVLGGLQFCQDQNG